jgi:hypothetical protein
MPCWRVSCCVYIQYNSIPSTFSGHHEKTKITRFVSTLARNCKMRWAYWWGKWHQLFWRVDNTVSRWRICVSNRCERYSWNCSSIRDYWVKARNLLFCFIVNDTNVHKKNQSSVLCKASVYLWNANGVYFLVLIIICATLTCAIVAC